ncbi:phosphoribosylglycinamide formyltransferase [Gordonia sp. ABSL1-1]|uniref:phosphoribosylglycinamide formyltransferase n=1 Tax=Gordonia sp. ABSL1-1 TaxID=3053923 RepID=UPI002573341E|nr:phosphoribosylglycinamide formyltransferase [Gordonia sp. ABSL1-1]MDL9937953.1 phosphoribosylglycinamide formyltransferase [Gordonia sp. ABSL1-1]
MASGTGSLLEALLERSTGTGSPFTVAAIVVDRECRAEEIARTNDIPLIRCRLGDHADRAAWDQALTDAVDAIAPEWVVTAGFMKILGPAFLSRFGGRVVNSHPALLPAFPGAHGVDDALAYGVKVTGSTVHLVDAGVDTGPILAQQVVAVEPDDDVAGLHERIKSVERVLLADVVTALVTQGVVIDGRKARIP